jgi:hypothetical protein
LIANKNNNIQKKRINKNFLIVELTIDYEHEQVLMLDV